MKLADRLATIQRYGGTPRPPTPERLRVSSQQLELQLPGRTISAEGGECFVADTVRHAGEAHGIHTFDALAEVSGEPMSLICRDQELAHLDIRSAVFLDTETTGLGLGVGTYVFLVGAGYFDGSCFRVRQFFLRSPADEGPFLSALSEFLGRFSALVTFNGKAFDWPLLENRFVLRRRPAPLDDPLHLDLLHPARSLWKRRLASCSLSSLEAAVLDFERTEEDVPGWMIPSLYFKFQRSGDAVPLRSVFYHNLHDVLSLAILAIHISRIVSRPGCGLVGHALDYMSLARAYDRAAETELAAWCYAEALQLSLSAEERSECLIRLAGLQKRQRWWDAALATWDKLMDEGPSATLFALVERAKYSEHVDRDFDLALEDVEHALRIVSLWGEEICQWEESSRAALEHRLSRLLNRLANNRPFAKRGRRPERKGSVA